MPKFEAKLADGTLVFVPDVEVAQDKSEYVFHPAHGMLHFMVEGLEGFIGWAKPELLGFDSVLDWMKHNRYVIKCTCMACCRFREHEGLP